MSREELLKTGPLETDADSVVSAAFDIEDIANAAANWPDAQDIQDKAREAISALDDLSGTIAAWFERHPE